MRLTLRSLLAYLDGVLPTGDQEDLAGRVAASAVAQSLVGRIRRVIGLPGVGAPRLEGRGLGDDPNSVAEYLDNSLPGERLETFERICIESDMHLAEVASCHAILAEAVRDPAAVHDIDEAERQRLLRAVRQRLAGLAVETERQEALANAAVVRAAVAAEPAVDTILAAAPAGAAAGHRPAARSPWMAWASAALALLLLIALGGVLTWSVMRRGQRETAQRPQVAAPAPAAQPAAPFAEESVAVDKPDAAAPAPAPSVPEPVDSSPPAAEVVIPDVGPEEAEAVVVETAPPVAAPPAAPQPPAEPPVPAVAPLVPDGRALAIAALPTAAAVPALPQPAAAPAAPPVDGGFVGTGSLVLHRTADGDWGVLPAGGALGAREELVALPSSHPDLNIGGVTIRLLPGTEAITSIDADGTPRIEIVRGRMIARASRADARLGITAGRLAGTVTAGLTAPVAAAVDFTRPSGADPAAVPARQRAEVITTSGAIGWRQQPPADGPPPAGIAAEGMLEARSALVWDAAKPTLVAIEKRASDPEWTAATAAVDAVERRAREALAAKLVATEPLDRALQELVADRRSENRTAAAAALAMLGEYDAAVELLSADAPGRRLEPRQWAALEAQTVPLALTRGGTAAAALRQAFQKHGPHGKAELLDALARGFDDEALAAGADRRLVEALDEPDLVVRRYAIKNLVDIVKPSAADRLRYRADGLPDLRAEGVGWWRGQLEKGLIRRPPAG